MPTQLRTFEIDARIRRLAADQLGVFTVRQAADCGVDEAALRRRRRAEALEYVFDGVMRLTAAPRSVEQRIIAGALAVNGVIIGTSAAVSHGMPVPQRTVWGLQHVPEVLAGVTQSHRTPGVRIVRSSLRLPTQPWHGVRRVTASATIVQLPRFVDLDTVERCIDHGIADRLLTASSVLDLVRLAPPSAIAHRAALTEMLECRVGGVGYRSRTEQLVAGWLRSAELTGWRPNHSIRLGRRAAQIDFAWPSQRVGLEISPFFTHGSRDSFDDDMQRRRALIEHGWRIVEAGDPNLLHEAGFAPVIASLRTVLRAPAA